MLQHSPYPTLSGFGGSSRKTSHAFWSAAALQQSQRCGLTVRCDKSCLSCAQCWDTLLTIRAGAALLPPVAIISTNNIGLFAWTKQEAWMSLDYALSRISYLADLKRPPGLGAALGWKLGSQRSHADTCGKGYCGRFFSVEVLNPNSRYYLVQKFPRNLGRIVKKVCSQNCLDLTTMKA